ncbi:hypothetical protein HK405_012753, partial [Cladochytrium tenue]
DPDDDGFADGDDHDSGDDNDDGSGSADDNDLLSVHRIVRMQRSRDALSGSVSATSGVVVRPVSRTNNVSVPAAATTTQPAPAPASYPPFATITRISAIQVPSIFFEPARNDAIFVIRVLRFITALVVVLVVLGFILGLHGDLGAGDGNAVVRFLAGNYAIGVSLLLMATAFAYHMVSSALYRRRDGPADAAGAAAANAAANERPAVRARQGPAGTSGADELDGSLLRNPSNAAPPWPMLLPPPQLLPPSRARRRPPPPSARWFRDWRDGDPDYADLTAEVRFLDAGGASGGGAAGAGLRIVRLPAASPLGLAMRARPVPEGGWTLADTGGVSVARPCRDRPPVFAAADDPGRRLLASTQPPLRKPANSIGA